jgi:hypothetical protein
MQILNSRSSEDFFSTGTLVLFFQFFAAFAPFLGLPGSPLLYTAKLRLYTRRDEFFSRSSALPVPIIFFITTP